MSFFCLINYFSDTCCRAGIPKRLETTIFFNINSDVASFRKHLARVVPVITTTAQAKGTRDTIAKNKQEAVSKGQKPDSLPIVGVTLGFSKFALKKVSVQFRFEFNAKVKLIVRIDRNHRQHW